MQDDNREQLVVWVKKRLSNHNEAQPDCDCQYCDWRRDYLSAIDTIDTLTARIAELEGEVRRLTQCETNMTFLLNCIEKAQFNLPDYTLGTWQDRARGLAPAIATLRTRLAAIEKAAGEYVDAGNRVVVFTGEIDEDDPCTADEFWAKRDRLAALLAEKGAKG